jgi:signal transduction histidine kinase
MRQPTEYLLKQVAGASDRAAVDIRKVLGASGRRSVAVAVAVLTLGLTGGAAASTTLALAHRDAASAGLALRTASVRSALDTTFQRYADTMHDVVAAVAVSPAPGRAAVDAIVGDRLPGAQQVLVVGVDHTVLVQHRVDHSTPPAPATLTPEPRLAQAMDLSRASGRIVASPAHVLPADLSLPPAHRQPAFEMAAPVQTEAFRGWVIVSLRAADLLDTSLRGAGVTGVSTVLSELSADGVVHEVAGWSEGGKPQDVSSTFDVALAGHAWQVRVRPTGEPPRSAAPALTTLATTLISGLAAAAVLVAGAARGRAEDRARRSAADRDAAMDRARRAEAVMREREAELTGLATWAGENLHAPLHTVAGFTDLLAEEAAPQIDPASRGFLDRISRSTTRMLGVVDELLAFASTTDAALRLDPVDAERLALEVVADRLADIEGERPSIEVGELPLVTADAELLRQVLDHLVGNAVRFVRHGCAPRVTVGAREQDGGWWRIEVADRGIGVPAEQRDRIFAPFHRAPAAEGYPGSGLGLAICRRIVELHGGQIGVDANAGGGSVFWFTVSATGVTVPDEIPQLAAL